MPRARPSSIGCDAAPDTGFTAHRGLIEIHPFNDGNGRAARLMNLILLRGAYPPIAVRPDDRPAYARASEEARSGLGTASFDRLLSERLDTRMAEYLAAARQALAICAD